MNQTPDLLMHLCLKQALQPGLFVVLFFSPSSVAHPGKRLVALSPWLTDI